MAELGITEFERFEFISQPAKTGLAGAVEALSLLDALNPDRTLTRVGELMCAFPLLPRHSRMIVEAMLSYPDVVDEVLVAASFLSTMSPYVLPPGEEMEARRAHHAFRDASGDFVSYLKIFKTFKEAREPRKWCEANYLDERTLLEIVRIKEQLELIVSAIGMPIVGGGSIEDYLCAVSRGLIQFVCARQERGLFRSLTAEKIQIHPGSVMFRENPTYLVAGEIVRTTRMYAMSVSPLEKRMLSRISPRLEGLLARGEAARPSKREEERVPRRGAERAAGPKAEGLVRDFTNKIKIGSEIFDLEIEKKKKIAILDWPKLRSIRDQIDRESLGLYKSMKGVVRIGRERLLDGEKLDVILRIAAWLDPERDLARDWPKKRNFDAGEGLHELLASLDHVLQVAKARDKTAELGFVALYTDAEGMFWFRCSRGFHTALSESLASLEALADRIGDEGSSGVSASPEERERVNALYRKLSSFFD
jgi:hypothetical protein